MGSLKAAMAHVKNDVMYPTDKKGIVTQCNNMSDLAQADRDWFAKTLPEGKYKNADEVMRAVLSKV